MDTKKPFYHLLIRITILILLIIGAFAYSKFAMESNTYSDVGPTAGFLFLALVLGQAYCLFLLIEMIYLFSKKNKSLARTNLALLIIIEVLPILVLFQLLV